MLEFLGYLVGGWVIGFAIWAVLYVILTVCERRIGVDPTVKAVKYSFFVLWAGSIILLVVLYI